MARHGTLLFKYPERRLLKERIKLIEAELREQRRILKSKLRESRILLFSSYQDKRDHLKSLLKDHYPIFNKLKAYLRILNITYRVVCQAHKPAEERDIAETLVTVTNFPIGRVSEVIDWLAEESNNIPQDRIKLYRKAIMSWVANWASKVQEYSAFKSTKRLPTTSFNAAIIRKLGE